MSARGLSTSKDSKVFLKHIIESIEWIEKDINNLTEDQFMENAEGEIEIIAVTRIPCSLLRSSSLG